MQILFLSGITTTGRRTEDFNVERTLFVSFPVKRLEDMVKGAKSREAVSWVFWIDTQNEFADLAKEQDAQLTSERVGKTPCIVQINDVETLLGHLRLKLHKFVTSL